MNCYLERQQQNLFALAIKTIKAAFEASFFTTQIIAKKSKPFTDSGYVKQCTSSTNTLYRETKSFLKTSVFL
jgi:hypothetical protein